MRDSHKALNNLTLPVDDPFWNTHAPPNGWRCRCSLTSVSQTDYDKGLSPRGEPLNKTAPAIEYRDWYNAKTGKSGRVPVGIDPGWDYNPGKVQARDAAMRQMVDEKIIKLDAPLGAALGADLAASMQPARQAAWDNWLTRVMAGHERNQLGWLGVIAVADLAALATVNIKPVSAEMTVRPGVVHGPKAARHEKTGDALTMEQWGVLPEYFANAKALLLDTKSGKPVYLLAGDGRLPQLAVEVNYELKKPKNAVNAVVSAYTVSPSEVKQRIKRGDLVLLRGEIGE